MKTFSLSALALLFVSCSYHVVDKEAPAVNTVELSKKFCIKLPEDHSKGYTWALSNDYDTKAIGYIKAVWHGNDKGVEFNFQADAPGKTELVFYSIMYRDTAATKRFIVEVK